MNVQIPSKAVDGIPGVGAKIKESAAAAGVTKATELAYFEHKGSACCQACMVSGGVVATIPSVIPQYQSHCSLSICSVMS